MSEPYPQKASWPYVLCGLMLFGVALWPPSQWPKAVRHVYVDWIATHVVKTAAASRSSDSNLGEPKKRIPRVSINYIAKKTPRLPSTFGPLPSISSVDPVIEKVASIPVLTVSEAQLDVDLDGLATESFEFSVESQNEPDAPVSAPLAVVAAPTQAEARNFVWQPPNDWVPTLIEPLADTPTQSHPTEVAPPQTRTLLVERSATSVPIAGPVAKQQGRFPRAQTSRAKPNVDTSTSESINPKPSPSETEVVQQPRAKQPTDLKPVEIPQEHPQNTVAPTAESPKVASASDQQDSWGANGRMLALLQQGSEIPRLEEWSKQLRIRLTHLRSREVTGSETQQVALARIQKLATYPVEISHWLPAEQRTYWRIRHAVMRNASVWSPLLQRAANETAQFDATLQQLTSTSSRLAQRLTIDEDTKLWSSYLELEKLTETDDRQAAGRQAERTLGLLLNQNLNPSQKSFLRSDRFRKLDSDLRAVVSASIPASDVVRALNNYENETNTANARAALATLQRFGTGPHNEQYDPTLDAIDAAYRNANMRVAVSEELINRFMPAMHQYAEQVNDTILGAAVRGNNSTLTNLSVKLIPDYQAIRLGLFANGSVDSNTASRKGPVVVYNQGKSQFAAGKELMIRPDGIFYNQTETRATTGNRLVGMRTDLDGIPFIGSLIRSIARRQHDEQRPFMRAEILARVERSANKKMDVEVNRRLANVEGRVQSRVVNPLRQMQLDPRAMEMRTTDDRVILRTRLAGPHQLAAHTPRPQARSDSKMSFQIHQSAANNMIEQLDLKGRRMTLGELTTELSDRFGTKIDVAESRRDCIVQFAKNNPLEFDFEQGQIKLTIHFAELDNGDRSWKDFSVCGYYRADVEKLDVELVRDGSIELITEPLKLRDQIALRSIFTKVFAANPKLDILRKAIQQQPKLRSLVVTQFTIRDGWMAVSLGENGPDRIVERSIDRR